MMDQEKAAKYFIVVWVKEWSLKTYLDAVGDGERIDFADAHKLYPWLPSQIHYFIARSGRTRKYIADLSKKFSDKLWDATDDKARLALWPEVLKLNGGETRGKVSEAQREFYKSKRDFERSKLSKHVNNGRYERGSGSCWSVVK